jgi:predicted ribosomally synthesized peptide with nif11-like leader
MSVESAKSFIRDVMHNDAFARALHPGPASRRLQMVKEAGFEFSFEEFQVAHQDVYGFKCTCGWMLRDKIFHGEACGRD